MDNNLAQRLRQSMPEDEWDLLARIAAAAMELGLPLYLVGGLPRDLFLGHPSNDFDLVVEGDASKLAGALSKQYGGSVTVHTRFRTAKWDLRGSRFDILEPEWKRQALDLISARSETYRQPAVLPTVKAGTIEDDLRRRDFSINALAIRLDGAYLGEMRDDSGGLADLQHRIVRVLHSGSFIDDPTRMYRAVRYEQRYGFKIADETMNLLPGGRPFIEKLSAQRIRHELELMLHETNAAAMLSRLGALDLLKPIHPALFYDDGVRQRLSGVEGHPPVVMHWLLWLMVLSPEQLRSVNNRLHFRSDNYAALLAASRLWTTLPTLSGLSPSQWVERLEEFPFISVRAVAVSTGAGPLKSALWSYLNEWHKVKPKTTGDDLKKLGLEPGPVYRSILLDLRRAWIDGRVKSELEERAYLVKLIAELPGRQTNR